MTPAQLPGCRHHKYAGDEQGGPVTPHVPQVPWPADTPLHALRAQCWSRGCSGSWLSQRHGCSRGLQLHHSLTLCEMLARAVGWLRPMGPPTSHAGAPALPSHPLQHQMGRVSSGCWLPLVPPCPVGLSWPHGEDTACCCHPWVLLMAAPAQLPGCSCSILQSSSCSSTGKVCSRRAASTLTRSNAGAVAAAGDMSSAACLMGKKKKKRTHRAAARLPFFSLPSIWWAMRPRCSFILVL